MVALVLLAGGAAVGYRTIKMNRPAPMWVPLAVNPELSYEQRTGVAKELKSKLATPETLLKVSKELRLAQEWQLPDDQAAATELGKRLFVDPGQMSTPTGSVPSLNIGVRGKLKEKELSGRIAMRMMQDVSKILGIKMPAAAK